MILTTNTGAWSTHARCAEHFVSLKPQNMSFEEAAAVPLAAMTALQCLRQYKGDLSGKTVFVPAGCMFPLIPRPAFNFNAKQ